MSLVLKRADGHGSGNARKQDRKCVTNVKSPPGSPRWHALARVTVIEEL